MKANRILNIVFAILLAIALISVVIFTASATETGSTDTDGDDRCDYCGIALCGMCGKLHTDFFSKLFCFIINLLELIFSFARIAG